MTNEEALMILKSEMPSCGRKLPFTEGEKTEAYEIAFEAIEKQIPKDVGIDGYGWYECPDCHNKRPNWLLGKDAKWCPYCGQRICWEEGESK